MTDMIQLFAIIHLTTIGASHLVAHQAWARFFMDLAARGTSGVILVGFLSLGFGSVVASFHPVWSGLPLMLTLFGWGQVVKGFVYLCLPGRALRRLQSVSVEDSGVFRFPGVAMLLLAAALVVHRITGA